MTRSRPFHFALFAPLLLALAATPVAETVQPAAGVFNTHFTDQTMRVDYFHTGGPRGEVFALDRVVNDGPWPGSRTQLVDDTNLGPYFFEVIDAESGRTVYSRGFASIYGEWESTPEVKEAHRTFHESLRFPWPKAPVRVALKKRQADQSFQEVWTTSIDPDSRFVHRAPVAPRAEVLTLFEHGAPAEKVDLLLLADGYTAAEAEKFRQDATRLLDALFAEEPFKSRKGAFNVRAIHIPAAQSGIHRARGAAHRRSALSTEFNIFDSERYVLTLDNRALRDIAAAAPYEFVEILANDRTYGGGGIFNDHATTTVDSAYSAYVFVHEFAHHFAALADEYYTSDVAYETGGTSHVEPWGPNATALHDPATLKWRDLVTPGTPLPTPWDKATYEAQSREFQARRRALRERNAPETEMDALFREQEAWETKFFKAQPHSGKVGAFEGASYEAKGLYRPELDCIMFTRNPVGFCAVCRRAIGKIIDMYSR